MPESDDRTASPEARLSSRPGGPGSLIGTVLSGRYRIDKLLGEGGMGAVYRAEHAHMRKRFAVKVLHSEMSRMPEVVARFEREAMAAAHIEHPNVAAATDFGKLEDGSFFLVLEYVEGKSLREAIAEGPLDVGRALRILRQIAAGLQRAHALGIVHRDLKPENVMLIEREGETDFVKVLDFGIAKVPVGELASEKSQSPPGAALTQLGMVYGTPEYMAPEQALGQPVDPRADIYSLGIIAYEMLAGVRPFEHASKVTLLGMHVTAPVPPFGERVPGLVIPEEVDAVVRRMLEKEAERRYADAKALIEGIDAIWTGEYGSIPGPRGSLISSVRGEDLSRTPAPASLRKPPPMNVDGHAPTASALPMPAAPATVTGRQPPLPLMDRLRHQFETDRRPFIIGGVATLATLVLLALVAGGSGTKVKPRLGADAGTEVEPTGVASSSTPVPEDIEFQITAAVQAIERGDFGTGIAKLTDLEKDYGQRADIHRALEKAYTATRNTKEALRETELLLKADPEAVKDLKLAENVRNAAVGRDAPDAAFALVESKMGAMGAEILYDIAYGTSAAQYPQAATRAQRSLQKEAVRKVAPPGLVITLDLRAAQGCDAKRALLPRALAVGDSRTVGLLKQYTPTRGCGFASMRDCWPCMHKDNSLQKTISGIEERIK